VSTPSIRTARTDDIDTILGFWSVAAAGESVTDDQDGVRGLIERDPDALYLAEIDGVLVGTIVAGWDGWRGHLYRIAVAPSHRRRGIARVLLDAAEQRFARLGGRRVDAIVLDENTLAHEFWAATGYERQLETSRWVKTTRSTTV
jgi:ribosomal protein S18 acetylase RimI-like enzyme